MRSRRTTKIFLMGEGGLKGTIRPMKERVRGSAFLLIVARFPH